MSNYKCFYLKNTPVFVTLVTQQRQPWLQTHADVLLASMRRVKQLHVFKHHAHVILPDHVHWIFKPVADANFSEIVAAVKRDCSWRLKQQGFRGGWQQRFYDHLIRDEQDGRNHLDYVHYNPVKHGYVLRAADYQYTSLHEWIKRGLYPENWGECEPEQIRHLLLE